MKRVLILLIKMYQQGISSILPFNHCRFYPPCSEYSIKAIEIYGIFGGFWLTLKRLFKCHPFSASGGYDPVP